MFLDEASLSMRKLKTTTDQAYLAYRIKDPYVLEQLFNIAKNDNELYSIDRIVSAVLSNENITSSILKDLYNFNNTRINMMIAQCDNASSEVLELIADLKDNSDDLLNAIASNPNTPEHVLLRMLDSSEEVLTSMSYNPNLSSRLLIELSNTFSKTVLSGVASNANTPLYLINRIFDKAKTDDSCRLFLYSLSKNENIPKHIIKYLLLMNDRNIVKDVLYCSPVPKRYLYWLSYGDKTVRAGVAENENAPVYVLSRLARDANPAVRSNVAYNKNTPPKVLEQLARDGLRQVRSSVAENENTPAHILELLAKDYDDFVRSNVAENENTPAHVLAQLAKEPIFSIKYNVLQNVNTNIDTLFSIYNSDFSYITDYYLIIDALVGRLCSSTMCFENIRELLYGALNSGKRFNNLDDFVEAYSLTYGEDGLLDTMIAIDLYAA